MFLHKLCFLDIGSPQKVHKVDIKSGSLQEVHRKSTGSPQKVHKKSTKSPQEVHRKSTESPQKVHRKSTGSPQKVHRKSTESPQKSLPLCTSQCRKSYWDCWRCRLDASDAGWVGASCVATVGVEFEACFLFFASRPSSPLWWAFLFGLISCVVLVLAWRERREEREEKNEKRKTKNEKRKHQNWAKRSKQK